MTETWPRHGTTMTYLLDNCENFWNVENWDIACSTTVHQASSVERSCGANQHNQHIFVSGWRRAEAEAYIHRPGESETRLHNNRTSTRKWEMSGKLNTFGIFLLKTIFDIGTKRFCQFCAGGCSKGAVEGEVSLDRSQGLEGQEKYHLWPSQDQTWGGGLWVKAGCPKL